MNKNKKNVLKILLTITSISIFGILGRDHPDTLDTLKKSHEPVIYYNKSHEDVRQILCDAIKEAKENIFLRIYNLSDSNIISSLKDKLLQQIPIELHYQNCKKKDLLNDSSNTLKIVNHPKMDNKLMHLKSMAIDYKTAWMGSANYTPQSFDLDSNIIIGIPSAELCNLIIQRASGSFKINEQKAQYYVIPQDKDLAIEQIISLIKSAKKNIRIAMYALTNGQLLSAINDAYQNNITMEIIIDKSFAERSKNKLQQLDITYLPIWIRKMQHLLHHKLAIIDDCILICGSANWSENGFNHNDEDILILYDLSERQQKKLGMIWKELFRSKLPLFDPYQEKNTELYQLAA